MGWILGAFSLGYAWFTFPADGWPTDLDRDESWREQFSGFPYSLH